MKLLALVQLVMLLQLGLLVWPFYSLITHFHSFLQDGAGDFTFVQGTNVSSGNANTFFNRLGAILSRPSEEQVLF
jgi:hypothetical protein